MNPITHLVTTVRALMDGSVSRQEIAWLLSSCSALVAVFAPLTMRVYRAKE